MKTVRASDVLKAAFPEHRIVQSSIDERELALSAMASATDRFYDEHPTYEAIRASLDDAPYFASMDAGERDRAARSMEDARPRRST